MKRRAFCPFFAAVLCAQQPCAIRGIVIDALSKQPLPQSQVFAAKAAESEDDSTPPLRQLTDANGNFCFARLGEGSYTVRARRNRYIDVKYDKSLEVGAARPQIITLPMPPQAVISGALVDSEGEPVQGATIELLKGSWKQRKLTAAPVDTARTDDQGRYRFAKLPAGTYFVSAAPALAHNDGNAVIPTYLDQSGQPFRRVSGRMFYKNSINFRDATPIRMTAGQEISRLTLTLRTVEARHVSGVVPAEASNVSPRILYLSEDVLGGPAAWHIIPIQSDGSFVINGIFPDHYEIFGPGVASKEIDVTSGDIDDLSLEANLPIQLQISVHFQQKNTQPFRDLDLINKTPGQGERSVAVQQTADNKFKAEDRSGTFEIKAGPYFIQGIEIDGEAKPSTTFEVHGTGLKSVDLYLSSNTATIDGRTQEGSDAKLLIENESDAEWSETKETGPDGKFQLRVLRPGRYRVYAFEEFNREEWGNPDLAALLSAKSIVLDVKEGARLHVNLPVISSSELQAAIAKTGY